MQFVHMHVSIWNMGEKRMYQWRIKDLAMGEAKEGEAKGEPKGGGQRGRPKGGGQRGRPKGEAKRGRPKGEAKGEAGMVTH